MVTAAVVAAVRFAEAGLGYLELMKATLRPPHRPQMVWLVGVWAALCTATSTLFLNRFLRVSAIYTTPHAPCGVLC